MSEYVVDFGDKSSAFVGLAMAEAESHGATLKERIVRCRECKHFASDELGDCCTLLDFEDDKPMDNGFCAWGERRNA